MQKYMSGSISTKASNNCMPKKLETITDNNLHWDMTILEFDNYVDLFKI